MIVPPHPEILTHGCIPTPMHGLAPRVIRGPDWWDQERRRAYKEHQFHCWACGVHKLKAAFHRWLEGHERYEIDYERGRMTYVGCCALCHSCHSFIHSGRLTALLDAGQVSQEKFDAIMRHGASVMRTAGLEWPSEPDEEQVPWERWRLILGDDEYPPRFPSRAAWARHFGQEVTI